MYMYVRCGAHRLNGFIHVEINVAKQFKKGIDHGPPEIIADITKFIPVPEGSVKLCFSRATMEHLTYKELINHFLEANRILEDQGIIRMQLPCFDKMIERYHKRDEDVEYAKKHTEVSEELPIENHTDLFISRILYHDHYYLHNEDTLRRALEKCGFENVRAVLPGETKLIDPKLKAILYDTEKGRDGDSIIIEAQKSKSPPIAVRFEDPPIDGPIRRLLAKLFNIKIVPYIKRRPMFPSRLWFREKFFKNPY